MDRRQFLTRSGAGVAAVATGGVLGGGGVTLREHHQEKLRREAQDYAGDGRGLQRIWWSLDTQERVAALTFDDGPHPELTRRVLHILARHRVPATFFMIGRNAAEHRTLAADVVAAGHDVANHGWSHDLVVEQDPATLRRDIVQGARSIRDATGRRTRWYRPPRGMVTGEMLLATAAAGHEIVLWSVARGGGDVRDPAQLLAHLSRRLQPGSIIDLHDGTGTDPDDTKLLRRRHEELDVLPRFLDRARRSGYRFLTVTKLLDRPTPVL